MPEILKYRSVSSVPSVVNDLRARLMRRLHAIGRGLGLDHEELRAQMRIRWPAKDSLSDLTTNQLKTFTMAMDACRAPRERPSRPRGRPRDEDTILLATPRQREFLTRLLHRAFGMYIDPPPEAFMFLHNRLGDALPIGEPPERIADIATAIHLDADIRIAINATIVELKRRGLWTEQAQGTRGTKSEPRVGTRGRRRSADRAPSLKLRSVGD